ncbi:hypothetical protein BDN72DRAFT_177126 [Pluteus cervinus]|uniref:Uncharacterized protein n=1 Tax=Pluteus cervinus TaxID=181527 RepID=A0ACD3AJN9_9AGAR|nr:hypothetical protein BDN72DRAFT_177126 [Pluteus cervinus]
MPYVSDVHGSHYAKSQPSTKALALLRAALSGPYPSDKTTNPPLNFNLEVVEAPPNPDQLRLIRSYRDPRSSVAAPTTMTFISGHPASAGKTENIRSEEDIVDLGKDHPNAIKWPIVVDWNGGYATVGDLNGVQALLEVLRQKRDGEIKDEVDQPKGWFS